MNARKLFQRKVSGSELAVFKAAATDMRSFARSKFSRSLVHKTNFDLIRQVVFELKN